MVRSETRPEARSVVRDLEFSFDGSMLAAPAVVDDVAIYRTGQWRIGDLLPAGGHSFEVAAFARDGRTLFLGGAQTASVWQYQRGRWSQTRDLRLVSGGALSAQFSPRGDQLLTSGWSSVQIWDITTWQTIRELQGHTGAVRNARFSPDGRWIVTASSDSTAGVWEADSGRLMSLITTSDAPLTDVTFSTDGMSIITASEDSMIRVHACIPCEPDQELLRRARSRFTHVIDSPKNAASR
jgi:WD40 repeat protein